MKKHKKWRLIAADAGGGNELYAAVFTLAFLILAMYAAEFGRALVIARGVRDAAQAAAVAAATHNWDRTYKPRRDGHSGAYAKNRGAAPGAPFMENINRVDIAGIINDAVGAARTDGGWNEKRTGGEPEFRYRVTRVDWQHQPPVPGGGPAVQFNVTVHIDLAIPWRAGPRGAKPLELSIRAKSTYVPLY